MKTVHSTLRFVHIHRVPHASHPSYQTYISNDFCYHKHLYRLLFYLKIHLPTHLIPLPLRGLPDSGLAAFNAFVQTQPKYFLDANLIVVSLLLKSYAHWFDIVLRSKSKFPNPAYKVGATGAVFITSLIQPIHSSVYCASPPSPFYLTFHFCLTS